MKRFFSFLIAIAFTLAVKGQLIIPMVSGINSKDFGVGYGTFIHFDKPVYQGANITIEASYNHFNSKRFKGYGITTAPIKIGYQYTIKKNGLGYYVEPQIGFNLVGRIPNYSLPEGQYGDKSFNGLVTGANAGYLLDTGKKIGIISFGIRYEAVIYDGGNGLIPVLGLFLCFNGRNKREDY